MRPEQLNAVNITANYYRKSKNTDPDKIPQFLWNAKMRFGKTFTAYQLALEMNWKKILVMTWQPVVKSAWQEDISRHVDFKDWQFCSRDALSYAEIDKKKPFVCFGSLQDFLGKNNVGGIKSKNEWAHTINWDCIIFDEYHYGAWRDKTKDLFEQDDSEDLEYKKSLIVNGLDEDILSEVNFLNNIPIISMIYNEIQYTIINIFGSYLALHIFNILVGLGVNYLIAK